MEIINNNTVVVFTSEELKSVLESDNTYTYIYIGSDITLTSGIRIYSNKVSITIDGLYNNIRHKYIDMKSTAYTSAIYVNNKTTVKVIVKNLDITGYNYYGVICVPDSSTYINTVIEYNNITYIGTQIGFNPYGLIRFIDSNITIQDSYSSGNEVAEVNKIEIGGNTTINHKSTGNSGFWFRNSDPYFKILTNAKVNFTSTSRELLYGGNNITLTLEENSTFNITTYNGLSYGTFGTSDTTLNEGSSLTIKKTNYSGGYATWYSYGKINLLENSSLEIINDYTGLTTSNYNIYFANTSGGLYINNPKKVVLYNKVGNIIYTSNSIPFELTYNRLNLFTNSIDITSNISESTLPTYSWYKNNLSIVKGTFTNTLTTITENNYTEEELTNLPSLNNLIFNNKRIMSIGTFNIFLNPITDEDTLITGNTLSHTSLLIKYNDVVDTIICDENGNFTYTLSNTLEIGTEITFIGKTYNDVIYQNKVVTIIYNGDIFISNASIVDFTLNKVLDSPLLCSKENDLIINITDNRINYKEWKLYAHIENDLTTSNGEIFNGKIVFKKDNSIIELSEEKTLIYESTEYKEETTITIPKDDGILLKVNNYIDINKIYKSKIIWTLETN